ncbi:HNH endonuclease [Roseomonas sp. USHLN139]|uniref:HNH endonuclease n=1 Tax=Roseomonas sp. USHLN139 TaxID=3081298 RepID=UPI003B029C0F
MPGNPFYQTAAWRDARRAKLRSTPVCEAFGCSKRAGHVDHKLAMRKGGAPLDPSNLQALCHSCHSRKTARQDGAFGNAPRIPGASVDGRPADPQHRWNRAPGKPASGSGG